MTSDPIVFTVGHSTHPIERFVALLTWHGITTLVDVRTIPRSRRHPHFAREALAQTLEAHGITYQHAPELGGLRKPRPDSRNSAWRHQAFRGYADHMQTPEFTRALDEMIQRAAPERIAAMCAEAKWWQCHRQLIADALVARRIEVRHIMPVGTAARHELSPFARVAGHQVTYPGVLPEG